MNDYDSLKWQAAMKPNSTAAIAVIKMEDMRMEAARERRAKAKQFFLKLFGQA